MSYWKRSEHHHGGSEWLNEAALLYAGAEPGAEGGLKINLHSSCVGFRGSDSSRVGAGNAGVSTCSAVWLQPKLASHLAVNGQPTV